MSKIEINSVYRDEPIPSSSSKVIQWFGLDNFEPERAMTSHFISSKSLFMIRLPLVIYCFIVLWVDIIYTAKMGEFKHFFAYFTDLTFVGLVAYLTTTIYHHAKYLWSRQSMKRPSSFFNQPSIFNYLYVYLYHTIIVFNILTPVIFWALLAKEKLIDAHLSTIDFWISITLHTVTLAILLVDVFLNRMIVSINMIILVFGTVLLYLCLAFIIYAAEQWWVYSFLDWSYGPKISIWYIIVSISIVVCFFLQVGLHKLRDTIARHTMKKNLTSMYHHEKMMTLDTTSITQTSNFEPLASTIGANSHITFVDSPIEQMPTYTFHHRY